MEHYNHFYDITRVTSLPCQQKPYKMVVIKILSLLYFYSVLIAVIIILMAHLCVCVRVCVHVCMHYHNYMMQTLNFEVVTNSAFYYLPIIFLQITCTLFTSCDCQTHNMAIIFLHYFKQHSILKPQEVSIRRIKTAPGYHNSLHNPLVKCNNCYFSPSIYVCSGKY